MTYRFVTTIHYYRVRMERFSTRRRVVTRWSAGRCEMAATATRATTVRAKVREWLIDRGARARATCSNVKKKIKKNTSVIFFSCSAHDNSCACAQKYVLHRVVFVYVPMFARPLFPRVTFCLGRNPFWILSVGRVHFTTKSIANYNCSICKSQKRFEFNEQTYKWTMENFSRKFLCPALGKHLRRTRAMRYLKRWQYISYNKYVLSPKLNG